MIRTPDTPDRELTDRSPVDAEAFAMLYDRYAAQVYRTVYRRLGDRADAEDVTAEVFTKAWAAIHTYRPALAHFYGWLHRLAANAVVDHVRARRSAMSLDAVMDAVPDDGSALTTAARAPTATVEEAAPTAVPI